MGYSVIVKIATAGARYQEENGEIIQSLTGHVWLTLRNDETGQEFNFGFHPSVEGSMYTSPGLVRNDDWRYLDVTYQRSLAVSANQYNTLYQNCQAARADNTFGDYIGGWNACPDFAFQELWQAGIGTQSLSLDGTNMAYDTPQSPSAWPAANVSLLNAMANYNERYIAPALEGNYNDLRDRVSQLDEGYAMIVGGGLWEGKVPDDYIFQGWVTDGSGKTYPSYSPPYDNVQSTINVTTTTSITTPAQNTAAGETDAVNSVNQGIVYQDASTTISTNNAWSLNYGTSITDQYINSFTSNWYSPGNVNINQKYTFEPLSIADLAYQAIHGTQVNTYGNQTFFPIDPLVLDLNGDGVKLTDYATNPVLFDADHDFLSIDIQVSVDLLHCFLEASEEVHLLKKYRHTQDLDTPT